MTGPVPCLLRHGVREGSGIRRTVVGGIFVQETGLRNGACGADKFGFKDLAAVHWNHTAPTLYEHAIEAREGAIVAGGAV